MQSPFAPPRLGLPSYDCPHCCEYAQFSELDIFCRPASDVKSDPESGLNLILLEQHITGEPSLFAATRCHNCGGILLWNGDRLYYPTRGAPNSVARDLPSDLQSGYQKACAIIDISPAAASALLRIILQKLCDAMGRQPDGAETYVAFLSRQNLSESQRALLTRTCMRGTQPVQPGVIDEADGMERAFTLSDLIIEFAHTYLPPPAP